MEAFREQGITLYVGEHTDEGDILAPGDGLALVILVATEEAADEQWDAYLTQQSEIV